MKWKVDIVEGVGTWVKAIVDVKTGDIVVGVDCLDSSYVRHIVETHNQAVSDALQEGANIASKAYKEANNK